ncbi:TetR/AcrR family transcriptional regulator [uncultured Paracoccus sp.]|uniref:TetR/AcrR family transcriptional regulator n=1 Tax=uncultured Paracoccus sp. TaxID=189685 RepID=UPI002601A53E|nr:TetR/AcrR family transcriptional regulator [uncultured Paracoccus sp.]
MKASATEPTDSRFEIVEAAAECFMRRGYDKTTIDDIADALGATKGRVYHHFRSKNAIFFAVYREAMRYCFEAADPIIDLPLPAIERLTRMCEAHVMVMITRLSFQRGIKQGLEIQMRGPTTEHEREVFQELQGLRDGYEALFRRVLAEGNADGTLNAPDVPLAGRTILGALNAVPDWYRPRPDGKTPEAIATEMTAYLIRGLAAR